MLKTSKKTTFVIILLTRASKDIDFVKPVTACFAAVYGAELGRGTWAEIEPLLIMRPSIGLR